METQRLTGLSKRRQITMAGRAMFLWVAIAAVVVSLAVVALQFLYQQWSFNNRVIEAKYTASATLTKNVAAVDALKTNVDALLGNPDLSASRSSDSESNLQVIFDALPSKSDVTALATSVQQVIVPRSGVSLESISVPAEDGGATSSSTNATATPTTSGSAVAQTFNVVVPGNYNSIHTFLQNLEKTIRPMTITTLNVSGSDKSLRATISFVTYYQPDVTVDITRKAIR